MSSLRRCAVVVCWLGWWWSSPSGVLAGLPDSSTMPPVRNRLVLLPEARPMPAWSGYLAVHDLFLPVVAIGAGPFASVCGGAGLAPWLDRPPLLLSAQFTPYATERFALAAGAVYYRGSDGGGTGVAFAAVTVGRPWSGTLGLGAGFSGDGIEGKPVARAGLRGPFAADVEILAEAWFPPRFDPSLLAVGWRYSTGRISIDLAALFASRRNTGGPAPLLPWLTFAYGF